MEQELNTYIAKRNFDTSDKSLLNALENYDDNLFIDGSVVEQVDMRCMALLVSAQERLSHMGKTIILLEPSSPLRTLFYFTKLNQIIPTFKTIVQAEHYLRQMNKSFTLSAN